MWMFILRSAIAGLIVAAVTELAGRLPRAGALILSLPIISFIAFIFTWVVYRDLATVTRLSRETLVLVPLGLPFFLPLALAGRWGLGFWPAFLLGIAMAAVCVGLWLWLGPRLG
ncbi:MAG: hypothetical protein ACLFV3_02800 [Phycisphaeraceae bacterium]